MDYIVHCLYPQLWLSFRKAYRTVDQSESHISILTPIAHAAQSPVSTSSLIWHVFALSAVWLGTTLVAIFISPPTA